MAALLDALFVELSLDPTKFTKGQREAVDSFKKSKEEIDKRSKEMEKRAQSAGDFFGKLRGQVIALYAAFTAGKGIREFIQDTISTTANLGRMSRTMDISAQELAAWGGAGKATGGSADDMASSIYGLTQSLQQFMLTGESSAIPYFRALGISIVDTNGKLKTATQLYLEASEHLQHLDPARATALLTGLGANQSMINFLLQGPDKVRAQLAAQRSAAPSAADIKAAQDFQRAWNDIERESTKAGRTLLTALAPAILTVLRYVRDFATYLATHKAAAALFFAGLTVVVLALSVAMLKGAGVLTLFATGFRLLSIPIGFLTATALPALFLRLALLTETILPGLSAAFLAIGAAIEATPIGWILTGIAALAVAGYELYAHWDAVKKWWHGLWNDMAHDPESAAARIKRTNDDLSGRTPGVPRGGHPASSPQKSLVDQIDLYTPPGQASTPPGQASLLDRIGVSGRGATASEDDAWKMAMASEAKYGVPAGVTYAQWALESAHGKRMPEGSNNPFGIKAGRNHPGVFAPTTEEINGQNVRVTAKFRKFVSIQDAFDAHAKLLATDHRYAAAMALKNDPNAFADALTGIYATDHTYGAQLKNIMRSHLRLATAPAQSTHTVNDHSRAISSETHIRELKVMTQATDAHGIAKDIGRAIQNNSFASQANTGAV